jgi:hypothetical protein
MREPPTRADRQLRERCLPSRVYCPATRPELVTIVRMGHEARERCREDDLCAEALVNCCKAAPRRHAALAIVALRCARRPEILRPGLRLGSGGGLSTTAPRSTASISCCVCGRDEHAGSNGAHPVPGSR